MSVILIIIFSFIVLGLIYQSSQKTFEQKKTEIMNLYSSVLSDMNQDFWTMKIDPIHLAEISQSIQNLSIEIGKYSSSIQNENKENQEWFINIIDEFYRQIKLWISRHKTELEQLEQEISKIQSNKISEKTALNMTLARLEAQKISYRKL